jgi:NADPH-dependent 2,4-dienoyl-CoA reductase/sulfur reductase-like enzyme
VGAAQALLKAGARFAGRRVVVAGSGPLLLPVAAVLTHAGARLSVVAEQAPASSVARFAASLWRWPGRWWQAARYRASFLRARYRPGAWVVRAAGDHAVREVTLTDGGRTWTEPCDALCVGYGLVPATELARLLGCDVTDGQVAVDASQRTTRPGVYCAGEPTGIAGLEASLVEGAIAGLAATGRAATPALDAARAGQRRFADRLRNAFALRAELRELPGPDTIVCRCEDVRYGRFQPDWSTRQAKLYTRAGMGPCQGRVCGAALEFLLGYGADTVRLPVAPARVGTLTALSARDPAG